MCLRWQTDISEHFANYINEQDDLHDIWQPENNNKKNKSARMLFSTIRDCFMDKTGKEPPVPPALMELCLTFTDGPTNERLKGESLNVYLQKRDRGNLVVMADCVG